MSRRGSDVAALKNVVLPICEAPRRKIFTPDRGLPPTGMSGLQRKRQSAELGSTRTKCEFFHAVICILLITLIILSAGCAKKTKEFQQGGAIQEDAVAVHETLPAAEQPFVLVKGVSLSPKSFDQLGLLDFADKAKKAGTIISWVGDWNDLSRSDGAPEFLVGMSSRYDYTPLVQAQPFNQGTGKFVRPFDDVTKQKYKEAAVSFVEKYEPAYFGMGVEVNVFYEKDPQGFDDFVVFYNDVYEAVKASSLGTKVFAAFQLEKMKGLHGGLFGGKNDESKAEWQLLGLFKSDIVAFTTYPDLVYKSPSDMPDNYYYEILKHTDKPVVFTEIGWHAAASPKGWESSGAEQAEFVGKFLGMMQDVKPEFVIWSFVYDPDTFEPFSSMGMIGGDGAERPAWNEWVSAG
jgi:hypothetical protein